MRGSVIVLQSDHAPRLVVRAEQPEVELTLTAADSCVARNLYSDLYVWINVVQRGSKLSIEFGQVFAAQLSPCFYQRVVELELRVCEIKSRVRENVDAVPLLHLSHDRRIEPELMRMLRSGLHLRGLRSQAGDEPLEAVVASELNELRNLGIPPRHEPIGKHRFIDASIDALVPAPLPTLDHLFDRLR